MASVRYEKRKTVLVGGESAEEIYNEWCRKETKNKADLYVKDISVIEKNVGYFRDKAVLMYGVKKIVGKEVYENMELYNVHPGSLPLTKGMWKEQIWKTMFENDVKPEVIIHRVTGDVDGGEELLKVNWRRDMPRTYESFVKITKRLEKVAINRFVRRMKRKKILVRTERDDLMDMIRNRDYSLMEEMSGYAEE
jgi:folate-dependent phosphoribosylglycinamide formyltransferase PurN